MLLLRHALRLRRRAPATQRQLCHALQAQLGLDDVVGADELRDLMKTQPKQPSRRPKTRREPAPPPGVSPQLWQRQLQLETAATDEAVQRYVEMKQQVAKYGRAADLNSAQRLTLRWFEPLLASIRTLQEEIRDGVPGSDRRVYGPYLLQLVPEKLAVLTINELVNASLTNANAVVKLLQATLQVGSAVQAEVNAQRLRSRKKLPPGAHTVRSVNRAADLALEGADWGSTVRIKVGCALLLLLKDVARVEVEKGVEVPAFTHEYVFENQKKIGVLRCHPEVSRVIVDDMHAPPPRYMPMLVPPRPWTSYDQGGYYQMDSLVMRTRGSQAQAQALARAGDAPRAVLDGLTALGELEWRVNRPVFDTLDALWEEGEGVAGLPPRADYPLPPADEPKALRRVQQQNADLHSLRCDTMYKIQQARAFLDDSLYFPYNIDFRGRAYPIPPHLNHLGADVCRGLLLFAEARPLGPNGLRWIKIHLANLFGVDKCSFDDRAKWTESSMEKIRLCAADPLENRWWMTADAPFQALATSIELVAAVDAPEGPEAFLSRLPVHQDGSCNGLQHYAALGRDRFGAQQVNLLPGQQPNDVYGGVAEAVAAKVAADARLELPEDAPAEDVRRRDAARILDGLVDRKVVKQTVMTSVYGVTFIGARKQIQRQLEYKFQDLHGPLTDELDAQVYEAAQYAARVTLQSLGEVFSGARDIMDWLASLAKLVAAEGEPMAWITPLGLPVVQPYRRAGRFQVRTLMQTVIVASNSDDLPVAAQRQRSAFPPNYVHSLDSTHMLLTALRCRHKGIAFTAVHDSYWTHAGSVELMNAELRDAFVELYEQPLLEELLASLEARFPGVAFPPIPTRGDLDLAEVRQSQYFFN